VNHKKQLCEARPMPAPRGSDRFACRSAGVLLAVSIGLALVGGATAEPRSRDTTQDLPCWMKHPNVVETCEHALRERDQGTKEERASAYANLAQAYLIANQPLRAIEAYEAAIELAPLSPAATFARYRRGCVILGIGQYDRAVDAFDQIIRADATFQSPETRYSYIARGIVHRRMGDVDRAAADFTEAVLVGADAREAHARLGEVRFQLGEFDRAIEEYSVALISTEPFDGAAIYLFRGLAYLESGDFRAAVADFSKSISQMPSRGAYRGRSEALARLGDEKAAAADRAWAARLANRPPVPVWGDFP
jgi:tetratricopeptide (TPR) repeat protein